MNTATISQSTTIEDKKILKSSIASGISLGRTKSAANSSTKSSWFERNAKFLEDNIFAVSSMMIMVQTMWGGIAVASIVENMNDILLLGISAAATMGLNVAFLGQASAKWCLRMFIISIALNGALIAYSQLA